jgi:AcrR family transcriptional regulator
MPRMGLTPDKVVASAITLADSDGLEAVSLAVLADTLGVRVPSLYKHVDGLPDLQRRMAAEGMSSLATALAHAAERRHGRDALVSIAQAYRCFARTHRGQYQALIRPPQAGEQEIEHARLIIDLMTRIVCDYKLSGEDAVHAVRGIRAALHGFVLIEAAGGYGRSVTVEASFYTMVAMLDRGLAGWAQPGKSSGLLSALRLR